MYGSDIADVNYKDFEGNAADRALAVKFYFRPVQDREATEREGRPIFKEREYVEIRIPGDQGTVLDTPVTDMERQRFRGAYSAFKAGNAEQVVGTPLAEVPWITRSQVEELAHLQVRSLEQLSELSDAACSKFAGLYDLKSKAKKHLENAKAAAPALQVAALEEKHNAELAELRKALEDQASIIKQLKKDAK